MRKDTRPLKQPTGSLEPEVAPNRPLKVSQSKKKKKNISGASKSNNNLPDKPADEPAESTQRRTQAATMIQSQFRGNKARQQVKDKASDQGRIAAKKKARKKPGRVVVQQGVTPTKPDSGDASITAPLLAAASQSPLPPALLAPIAAPVLTASNTFWPADQSPQLRPSDSAAELPEAQRIGQSAFMPEMIPYVPVKVSVGCGSMNSSQVESAAAVRLKSVKEEGRLRLLRLRVPTMSVSLIMAFVGLLGPFASKAFNDTGLGSILLLWAAFAYCLGHLPSDHGMVRFSIGFLWGPMAMFSGMMQLHRAVNAPLYRTDPAESTPHGMCTILFGVANCSSAVYCYVIILKHQRTLQLLQQFWLAFGVLNLILAFGQVLNCVLTLVAGTGFVLRNATRALSHSTLSFLCLHTGFVKRVRVWLMFRGEAGAAAAGIAELVGSWSAEKVLKEAQERFRYVSAEKVLKEDVEDNKLNPQLSRLSESGHLGHVDAFLSHSWHDSADLKWTLLQEWREDFKMSHEGREPTLWIDKYCLDQNNIDESLACLPVYLAGCKKLVVLCGSTYLSRLWCLVEIMVFLEMGGQQANLEVKLVEGKANVRQNIANRSALQIQLEDFDPRTATCFDPNDAARLHEVIAVTGYDRISELVHEAFHVFADTV